MAKRGRPCKLTPDVRERILSALRAGNFRETACEWAGVSERTLQGWLNVGRREPNGPFGEFLRALLESERGAEIRAVGIVMKAAQKDAKHAEWWLSRKHPSRWSEKVHVTVDQELSAFLRACEAALDAKTYRAVLEIAARFGAASAPSVRANSPDDLEPE